MTSIKEIYEMISVERQFNLMSSPGCILSEARHIANLAMVANEELPLNIQDRFIWSKGGILPIARARVISKPSNFGKWGGEPTAIVIESRKPALQAMIVDERGYCLRPMRDYATYPSNKTYEAVTDREGEDISRLVSTLGLKEFGLDEPIMYLLPLLFERLNIKVGKYFYSNIVLFSRYRQDSNPKPWERV